MTVVGEFSHKPVLLQQCLDALAVKPGGLYVDGTLGGCGHSLPIVQRGGRLVGIDRDAEALHVAEKRLAGYPVTLVHDNYNNIGEILKRYHIDGLDGALLDLGVSSYQLDTPERGFSYRFDAPLDMRMDTSAPLRAWDVVNTYDAKQLEQILFRYGEEAHARAIVRKIIEQREQKSIDTTFELVDIIKRAIPPKARREKHPAKRTFQAIRIAVNDELSRLEQTVETFCRALVPGGRLAIMTFHSLEDRIVKGAYQRLAKGCSCPPDFPVCACGFKPIATILTKKPIVAGLDELEDNPRAASAKLRVLEKLEL